MQLSAPLKTPLAQARPADEAAARFESLYRAYHSSVLAYARRRLPGRSDDVVAETFLVAWRRLEDVPEEALPWLYGVARRVLADLHRAGRRQGALAERLAAMPGAPQEQLSDVPDRELAHALAALSEPERELIRLIYWEDLEPGQAAVVLGCSRAAAATRLWRARRRLRTHLKRLRGENE